MFARTDLSPEWNSVIDLWVYSRGGGRAKGHFEALGWLNEGGQLSGGVVFYDYNGVNATANIAIDPGSNARAIIRGGLSYAFGQLALRRLTFLIAPDNMGSIALVTRLGAYHEATLREAEPEGDLHIYALFSRTCPIWDKIRGKSILSASGT